MSRIPNPAARRRKRLLDGYETWRHRDGSVRVDHMDAREGDYFGPAPITPTREQSL